MKKIIMSMSVLLLLAMPAMSQRVMTDNFEQLKLHFATPELSVTADGYVTISADGYVDGGEVGAPAVPVLGNLLTVPFCRGTEVVVENAVYDTITLPDGAPMPLQPARSKSGRELPFALDAQVYATDAFYGRPLAEVTMLGVGRDRNYAVLNYSPVSINPVSGKAVVCRSADVTVRYLGSDAGATQKHYERYHTPAFDFGNTLNTLFADGKAVRTTAPVRMVVMAPQQLQCTALNEFVDWKRQQGMMVDLLYVANNLSAATMAAQLQQMYDEASEEAPAPTYLVLVGDHEQLRAFDCDLPANNIMHSYDYALDDHITDLYYVTWTDDMIPDCYQGRFSATDTATLRGIIEKTLFYERYQFPNDNYLTRAVLVAGVDNGYGSDYYDQAWRCADPTMDYVASLYVNAANGYDSVIYYKNNVNNVPAGVTVTGRSTSNAASSELRTYYNGGVGWINYSAHGNWNEWSIPSFKVNHVNQMTNNNMPSFMIGNCCLSSHFDSQVCFGEALLRKGNKAGAVAYIGATNSTFWDHDFYWSVGVRNNITNSMMLSYEAARRGMYDNLFHTHNESLTQWMVTAGKMVMAGNMSVNKIAGSSSSANSFVDYYWEIYELMGDPSLMPWLGRAENLSNISIIVARPEVVVSTVPGAYVALVDSSDHSLVVAGFANADGEVRLTVGESNLDHTFVSITAQGYKPYIKAFRKHNVGVNAVANTEVSVSPNPASGYAVVAGTGLRHVELLNMVGQRLQSVAVSGDRCRLDLTAIPAGLYLLRIESTEGTATRKLVVN